jgi:hypothetical protein
MLHTLEDYVMRSVSKVQLEGKLDDIPHNVQIKAKVVYCCVRRSWK